MTGVSRRVFAVATTSLGLLPQIAGAATSPASTAGGGAGAAGLQARLEQLAAQADVSAGVSVVHLESGAVAVVNASALYPMASNDKVATAVRILDRVDKAELRLDDLVTVERPVVLGGGAYRQPIAAGARLPIRTLLENLLVHSDNAAHALLKTRTGGPSAVEAKVRSLGVQDMYFGREDAEYFADYYGFDRYPPFAALLAQGLSAQEAQARLTGTPEGAKAFADHRDAPREPQFYARFFADRREQASASAMTALWTAIFQGRALSAAGAATLLDLAKRCETGPERLKGLLPKDVAVAHKTGTLSRGEGVVNDSGIIYLPEERGHLVVTVYVRHRTPYTSMTQRFLAQERLIAEIGRTAFDYFMTAT